MRRVVPCIQQKLAEKISIQGFIIYKIFAETDTVSVFSIEARFPSVWVVIIWSSYLRNEFGDPPIVFFIFDISNP